MKVNLRSAEEVEMHGGGEGLTARVKMLEQIAQLAKEICEDDDYMDCVGDALNELCCIFIDFDI